jgi:hypothetical protein
VCKQCTKQKISRIYVCSLASCDGSSWSSTKLFREALTSLEDVAVRGQAPSQVARQSALSRRAVEAHPYSREETRFETSNSSGKLNLTQPRRKGNDCWWTRLSSSAILWTERGWEEDAHQLHSTRAIRTGCRQGKADGFCYDWSTESDLLLITQQLRIDQRVFKTPSNRKLDVNVVQSNYHIELTPR